MQKNIQKYKVNLHITDRCVFRCGYCFGKFGGQELGFDDWARIIDSISESRAVDSINFSGGEPFLYKDFDRLVDYAYKSGFLLSVITNGLPLLDDRAVSDSTLACFDTVGISCDSMSGGTSRLIGRCTSDGRTVGFGDLLRIRKRVLAANPSCQLKLNTVVSSLNCGENVGGYVNMLGIDRWKVLKAKPFGCNQSFVPTDDQFEEFVRFNASVCRENMVIERDMANTYIIIDSAGNMLDSRKKQYAVIGNLLEEPFADCFKRFSLNEEVYMERYRK